MSAPSGLLEVPAGTCSPLIAVPLFTDESITTLEYLLDPISPTVAHVEVFTGAGVWRNETQAHGEGPTVWSVQLRSEVDPAVHPVYISVCATFGTAAFWFDWVGTYERPGYNAVSIDPLAPEVRDLAVGPTDLLGNLWVGEDHYYEVTVPAETDLSLAGPVVPGTSAVAPMFRLEVLDADTLAVIAAYNDSIGVSPTNCSYVWENGESDRAVILHFWTTSTASGPTSSRPSCSSRAFARNTMQW